MKADRGNTQIGGEQAQDAEFDSWYKKQNLCNSYLYYIEFPIKWILFLLYINKYA